MFETSKATRRRGRDPLFAERYFVGHGIDIGCGPDLLDVRLWPFAQAVDPWDLEHGDAQLMTTVADETYDFVYSSHTLEHVRDPAEALANWWRILKPGGTLVVVVPDEDMYEQGVWPPQWNQDHKHTFTIAKRASWSPVSRNLADLLAALEGEIVKIERLTEHYLSQDMLRARGVPDEARIDQTSAWIAECAIESVVRKP